VLGLAFPGGARHLALNYGDAIEIDADLELHAALADAACIIDILDERGVPLSGRRIRLPDGGAGAQRLRLRIAFRAELARGIYRVRARLVQAPDRHQHHRRVLCRYESDLSFEVVENSIERFSGLFPLPADIRIARLP
jgi:lipopolysaccharide transport system ATP-binding protein